LFADDLRTEPVGGSLQRPDIVDGEEGVIVLAEADSAPGQFPLDERVAVEPIGRLEWEEGGHPHDDGPQDFIPNVEVEMGEAAGLGRQNAMVGILRGKLGNADAEGPALLHALEDKVDAIGVLLFHAMQRRQNVVLLANAFPSPFDRNFVVSGVGIHPTPVVVGALAEDFFAHHRDAQNLPEEINHLFRPGQTV